MNALKLLSPAPVCSSASIASRTMFWGFDVDRGTYEKRGGLRTKQDLKAQAEEEAEAMKNDPYYEAKRRTIFGNKRPTKLTPRELLHYSDRPAGKGYSSYASSIYPKRPYVWPPMKRYYNLFNYCFVLLIIVCLVDFQWAGFHLAELWDQALVAMKEKTGASE